jgi:hypothetical protein
MAVLLACKLKRSAPASGTSAGSSSAQNVAAPSEVTLKPKIPSPGTSSTVTRALGLKLTMGKEAYRQNSFEKFKLTVKAADDFRITKALLDIEEKYETKQEGVAAEKKTVSPLAGSKFIVSRDDAGKLTAVDAEGTASTPAQVKLLQADFADLLKKDTVGAILPDRPLKLGEKLSPSASSLMQMMDIKDDGKTTLDGIEFIFNSIEGGNARFSMAFTLTMGLTGGLRMRAKLNGQLTLQTATVWLVGAALSGPVTVLDSKGDEKGRGDMKLTADQKFD